jgi:hypothetical protein
MDFLKMLNEAKLHSRMHFEGLDISVEVPAGGYRRGKNKKTGEEWSHKIDDNYGYIRGTHSPDGEHLDCYLRKAPKHNAKVYVMHQLTVDGSRFDEDKVMLGYSSKHEAIKAFKKYTFKPNLMYGGCTEFDMEHFQLAAYSASKSHAMLTDEKTYQEFKKKGLITQGIKSPLMVARRVSESLSEGLSDIAGSLDKGDLLECLEWGGMDEGFPIETVLNRAYGHYLNTSYMHTLGKLDEDEFRSRALNYIMETDALLTDVEDNFCEDLEEELGLDGGLSDVCDVASDDHAFVEQEELEEEPVMEANNFAVVVHTQMMENIGSAENPSWATAGTKVQLVQEGFTNYGEARALAAKVAAGEHEVEIAEGAYVLGIDVMPTGEYRQFYEAVEEEDVVEEETTEEVFFQQQVMEMDKLAGIRHGTYENKGTPSVHETRARLEALTQSYMEAVEEEAQTITETRLSQGQLAHTLRVVKETLKQNPQASVRQAIKAVCHKLHGDVSLSEEVEAQAEFEYGSLDEFNADARGERVARPKTIVKTKYMN